MNETTGAYLGSKKTGLEQTLLVSVAEAFSSSVMASESHERHLVNSLLQLSVRDL